MDIEDRIGIDELIEGRRQRKCNPAYFSVILRRLRNQPVVSLIDPWLKRKVPELSVDVVDELCNGDRRLRYGDMARMLRAGCIASDDDADGYVFITREAAVILAFIGTYYSINSMDPRKVRNLYERNAWEFMKLSAKEYLDYLCRQDGWDRKLTKELMEEVPDSSIDGTVADYLKYCYGFLELSYPALQLIYDMSAPGFRDLHLSDYENEQMRRDSVLVTLLWQMMVIGPGI